MDKFAYIEKICCNNQNQETALKMEKYMRNLFIFYGIESPLRKSLFKDFINKEKKNKEIDWELLDKCYGDEHRELQYFTIDYLQACNKYLKFEDIEKIMSYAKTKQWWDTIDFLDKIIGNIGLTDKRVDKLMLKYSVDDNMWLRRLAIDHQNGRKEKTNEVLLEHIIVNNLNSKEFFINKAIGWSLRDYSKVNPNWVKNFLNKYNEQMSNLSIKEASKYL